MSRLDVVKAGESRAVSLFAGLPAAENAQAEEVRRIIGRVGRQLARPARVALIGEFNTGKSTLANALLRSTMLPQSVVDHSRLPVLIHYAGKPSLSVEFADGRRERVSWKDVDRIVMTGASLLCLGLPVNRLKSFELVDTPGLATGQTEADELALAACQKSNIAIWCTAAMQAWKRTEMRVWESLPKRLRENSILAVTYKDVLDGERDVSKLRARLRNETEHQFRTLVLVAATEAAQCGNRKTACEREGLWQSSGGANFAAAVNSAVAFVLAHRLSSAERLLNQVTADLGPNGFAADH